MGGETINFLFAFKYTFDISLIQCNLEKAEWLPESEWVQETEVSIASVTGRREGPPFSGECWPSRR